MHCTLLIPNLFWPRESGSDAYRGLQVSALALLLARSRHTTRKDMSTTAWLCAAFGVQRQRDWPVAPLTLAHDGGHAGSACWIRADPVHVSPDRGRLLLADALETGITAAEAEALAATINRHFTGDGLQFAALRPDRWYLKLAQPPDMETHALMDAAGGDAATTLPTGRDAMRWHRLWNEVQMVLHEHPVNVQRESCGLPAVNSLWFWGAGHFPSAAPPEFDATWSDSELVQALGIAAKCRVAPLPKDGVAWLAAATGDRRHLIVLEPCVRPIRYGRMAEWRQAIEALNRDWLAPLHSALRSRRLSKLTIAVTDRAEESRFELQPGDLIKIWRVARPLEGYA